MTDAVVYKIEKRELPATKQGFHIATSEFTKVLDSLQVGECVIAPVLQGKSKTGTYSARISSMKKVSEKRFTVRYLKGENAVGVWRIK